MTDEEKQELCNALFVLSWYYPEDMIWSDDALVLDQLTNDSV